MFLIGPWVDCEGYAYRALAGRDGNLEENRVAMIEKTPRVRIRPAHTGCIPVWDDAGNLIGKDHRWPEFLNWCEGDKGSGPDDAQSRQWCDNLLKALGYAEIEDPFSNTK